MGRRIALMLASIHEGTSVRMLQSALGSFNLSSDALFVYPGGRLDFRDNDEYLRNSIYNLISKDTTDGIVSWASSLTGGVSAAQVSSFMKRYSSIAMTTIGLKVADDIPVIDFDAHLGFYSLVRHMIDVHGKKRIVYLRGPENHESSQERYRAYLEALADCGIPVDMDLVSSPFPWGEGRAAMSEIINDRGLVPSLDFDAIVCASDLIMFSAISYLESLGVNLRQSVAFGGFNDSDTNKLLPVAPTTVRMPVEGMIRSASQSISLQMDGHMGGGDMKLESSLVIRRSCGCRDSFCGTENARRLIKDEHEFIRWATAFSGHRIEEDDLEYLTGYARSLVHPSQTEKDNFLMRLSAICSKFFLRGGDADDICEIFHWFSRLVPLNEDFAIFCRQNTDRVILETSSHVMGSRQYKAMHAMNVTNSFKMKLLSTRSSEGLSEAMHTFLSQLGFDQAYLVMTRDNGTSCLKAGYNSLTGRVMEEDFPSSLLLPERYAVMIQKGAFVIEPVICDRQAMGYVIMEVHEGDSGSLIEDLVACISSAIKGIMLLEEANSAKEKAEKAERESSEFYANISEELREPLKEIIDTLSSIQDSPDKRRVYGNVYKCEHLLDLILTEKGEVEIHRTLVDARAFFSDFASRSGLENMSVPQTIPALWTDRDKLEQVMDILVHLARDAGEGRCPDVTLTVGPNGLAVSVSLDSWHPSLLRNSTSLQLAEQTVLLLSGSFHFKEHGILILLPWPDLSGQGARSGFGVLLFVRADSSCPVPDYLASFSQLEVIDDDDLKGSFSLPENLTQLAFDASGGTSGRDIVLNLMRTNHVTRNLPFLCTGLDSYGPDLWTSLTAARHSSSAEVPNDILCEGTLPAGLESLENFGQLKIFSSFDELASSITAPPSLIILDGCSREEVETIRSNRLSAVCPLLIVSESFTGKEVDDISDFPGILVANTCICRSEEFLSRLIGIFAGNQILPPMTGALVKKAIVYLNTKARSQISRWQVAESVNISEDYLTRIFKKDMGLSPWDYLNRYRVQLASVLLRTTGKTINEIASETGFQDQAYFCRVFKKITGLAPGKARK